MKNEGAARVPKIAASAASVKDAREEKESTSSGREIGL